MGNNKSGCCGKTVEEKVLIHVIQEKIRSKNTKAFEKFLEFLLTTEKIEEIDKLVIPHEKITTNPLGFAFLANNSSAFQCLLKHRSSIDIMEQLFFTYKIDPIEYLCSKGSAEILELYLPIYINKIMIRVSITSVETLSLSSTLSNSNCKYPFHIACKYGQIPALSKLHSYSKDLLKLPDELNLNTRIGPKGENCAHIACYYGRLDVVNFLFENCKADFFALNFHNENTILACVFGMNMKPNSCYFSILKILIEVIQVDILGCFEEVLLVLKDPEIIKYFEKKLKERGVIAAKEEIDERYGISKSGKDVNVDIQKILTDSFIDMLESISSEEFK